jgi:hypothetical protein
VKATANNDAIAHQHGADGGIRAALAFSPARELESFQHWIGHSIG